jgi:predicted ATP-dependent serine protease
MTHAAAQLCAACGLLPRHWRSFCATCAAWLGFSGRRRITEGGESERKRAIVRIQTKRASLNKFRTKESRG